jgi:hypothetical protein
VEDLSIATRILTLFSYASPHYNTQMPQKSVSETAIKHFDPKDPTHLVYEVYPKSRRVVYYLRGSQARDFSKITLDGYEELPSGLYLYKSGYGFGKKGTFLLSAIKKYIAGAKPVALVISKQNKKSIAGKTTITVTLPYTEVHNLLVRLGRINEDSNDDLRETVASFLSTKFPKKVKVGQKSFDAYQGGEIASILRRSNVAQKLNEEDLQGLKTFFPKIFEASLKGRKRVVRSERDALISNTKKVTDRIFLDDVIKEFQGKLGRKTSEEAWQKFLKDKVFRFLGSYVTAIDKQNVSIEVSYPDFVLVDVYGFIDVFEIKRHDTQLLAFDESHDNYYWKPELAQAISQIENYIDAVLRNAAEYSRAIKRKKHVDIRVIRPRCYIVAGASQQFKTEKEEEDFRKLGSSLKNVSFLLYDELLERLKNLRANL